MEAITSKQRYAINCIERNLHIQFKGETRNDAIYFIGLHIDASMQQAARLRHFLLMERVRAS